VVLPVAGLQRTLFWRGPDGPWTRGAVIVLHGGGGGHTHFCVASSPVVAPQVRWAERALAQGFAVFALDSSDRVTDNEGRVCGKVWDDEVRDRPNLDLPFIGEVIRSVIPHARPAGSRTEVFLTGLSSGGYMTTRAATHFDGLVTAFAPISSGDPYGWHRICEPGLTPRTVVPGAGFDNETGKQIIERGACQAERYPNEQPWESTSPPVKPVFRVFHHEDDGVNDRSCAEKVIRQLRAHGYREAPAFWLRGDGRRSLANHLWQDAYNAPLLEFFAGQLR
jgi:pimeloyl-ACP methyl ester carboxylesterase